MNNTLECSINVENCHCIPAKIRQKWMAFRLLNELRITRATNVLIFMRIHARNVAIAFHLLDVPLLVDVSSACHTFEKVS